MAKVGAWVAKGVRAGEGSVTAGAVGVFGIPAVVVDVGDVVAVAGPSFVDGESTTPGDAWVVEPDFCA
jgi:hypothetical protein